MDPKQLALANKAALEATGAFVVQPDGQVKMSADRGGGYAPPWVWAGAIPQVSGNDPQSQALRIKLSTPASDPSSPWRDSVGYDSGGPFSKHSSWDSSNGTYEGGIDWGTLLGTIGVGSLFAAPALAGLAGGGSGAAAGTAAGTGAGVEAGEGGLGLVGATAPAASSIAMPAATTTAAGAGGTTATIANLLKVGAPITAAVTNRLGQPSSSGNGINSIDPTLMARLSALLDMAQHRVASAQPVHDAAMSMAMRMAPTYADSPRLTQAINDSTTPAPSGNYSAATLAALKRMAGQ